MKIHLFFKILFLFLLLLLLQLLFSFGLVKVLKLNSENISEIFLFCIDISHIVVIIITITIWRIDIWKLFKKLSIGHIFYIVVIGLLITLLFPIFNIPNLLNSFSLNNSGIMMPSNAFFDNENFFVSKPYYIIRTLLIMPFLEEILYRGIIQNKLKEKFSTFWAIVLSSLFFGIGHMDFEQAIATFFGGLLLGYIYHKSKNLSTVVLLHALINTFVLFLKIEYYNTISIPILLYHFLLIALVLFISKIYPKNNKVLL